MIDTIVPNSYYDHAEHGRVKVVDVSPTTVSMEIVEENTYAGNGLNIPKGKFEEPSRFKDMAEPADIEITPDVAVWNMRGNDV